MMALEEDMATLLVVDDTPDNIDVLRGILRDDYRVKVATNGQKALDVARGKTPPDLILLDIMMPGMDGYQVCQELKADVATRDIPVIFVTAKGEVDDETRGFDLGAVDYITKPVSPPVVKRRVSTHLALYDQQRLLAGLVRERTHELEDTRLSIIQRLGKAAEFKDNETGMHVIRMSHYSRLLGETAGLSPEQLDLLFNAAPMHDVGKIGIADRVLLKPGKLDDEEWAIMRQHPVIGAEIIGVGGGLLLDTAREIALTHHEKWDGSGYPAGLRGEDIPLFSRVVAIADVFDALTTERPYKKAWPVDEALALLEREAGRHFDPQLVSLFLSLLPRILEIKETYREQVHEFH
jgi:putative two-component system response regulator